MFGNSHQYEYQALAQKDSNHVTLTGPGLFSSAHYGQKGHSFDYVPRVTDNDFTGTNPRHVGFIIPEVLTQKSILITINVLFYRQKSRMFLATLPPDRYFPGVIMHLYNISCVGLVCTQSKLERFLHNPSALKVYLRNQNVK